MPDDLRARIAAVAQHCREHKPEHECVCSMPPTDWDYELADAVIRELKEEKAVRNVAFTPPVTYSYGTPEAAVEDYNGAPPHVRQDLQLVHRYVTEWEPDNG